ncbi:MAG: hypothetical protein Q4F05_11175 [bacterium]|nr:hypothetical protein [bacterium]
MKYNLKQIMKRAWVIKRKNKKNLFGPSLKMAWFEFKKKLQDKLLNSMLNEFCSFKRPKYYRSNMSTKALVRLIERNNLTIPNEINVLLC